MKIRFLGTAAAEGLPAVFCNCDICKKVKQLGGKNVRTRSQILIENDLLIDFPMDTYYHMVTNKLDLSKIENIFITHAHMDHCSPMDLAMRGIPYAHNIESKKLNVFGSKTVITKVLGELKSEIKPEIKKNIAFRALKPYQTVLLERYSVTALPAVHTKGENCFIYLIENDESVFLQFNDSGMLPDSVYEWLKMRNIKLDIVSFDCTYGYVEKGVGRHMGALDAINERTRMKDYNLVKPSTKYVLTHFSHNGGLTYEQLEEKLSDMNFIIAFDGMEISI